MCADPPTTQSFFEVSAGERTVPGVWHENYWLRRHEIVYAWVADLVDRLAAELDRAPMVLDAGCGEGYGTAPLAERGGRGPAPMPRTPPPSPRGPPPPAAPFGLVRLIGQDDSDLFRQSPARNGSAGQKPRKINTSSRPDATKCPLGFVRKSRVRSSPRRVRPSISRVRSSVARVRSRVFGAKCDASCAISDRDGASVDSFLGFCVV